MSNLQQLQLIRSKLMAGAINPTQRATLNVQDVDGRTVRLDDPDILGVLDRRVAAEEAPPVLGTPAPAVVQDVPPADAAAPALPADTSV